MPADPVSAGRKGGRSRSAKKLSACRKNGFQKVNPQPTSLQPISQEPGELTAKPRLPIVDASSDR
jgi:hypothetical protein